MNYGFYVIVDSWDRCSAAPSEVQCRLGEPGKQTQPCDVHISTRTLARMARQLLSQRSWRNLRPVRTGVWPARKSRRQHASRSRLSPNARSGSFRFAIRQGAAGVRPPGNLNYDAGISLRNYGRRHQLPSDFPISPENVEVCEIYQTQRPDASRRSRGARLRSSWSRPAGAAASTTPRSLCSATSASPRKLAERFVRSRCA